MLLVGQSFWANAILLVSKALVPARAAIPANSVFFNFIKVSVNVMLIDFAINNCDWP
jgi:hypothetical protein